MPDSFSITIMAHPKRATLASYLAKQVGGQVVWDELNDQLDTQDRAWGLHDHEHDWCVVLEDDALPSKWFSDLGKTLERARLYNPRSIVSLYVGTARPRNSRVTVATHRADVLSAGWLSHDSLLWNVAVCIPTYLVSGMLEYVSYVKLPADQRIGRWARASKVQVLYAWPSLVDHYDGDSILKNNTKNPRVARRLGEQYPADTVVPI